MAVKKPGWQKLILEELKKGFRSAPALDARCGVKNYQEREYFHQALRRLVAGGEVLKAGEIYRLGRPRDPGNLEKLWRVMRAKKSATVKDLIELTGVSRDTVYRLVKKLDAEGFIRPADPPPNPRYLLVKDQVMAPDLDSEAALAAVQVSAREVYDSAHQTMQAAAGLMAGLNQKPETKNQKRGRS